MNIISYNILNPYHAILWGNAQGYEINEDHKRVDNWKTRKHIIIKNLKISDFSVACLQEVSSRTLKTLSKQFTIAGFSTHYSKTEEATHGVALLYDPDKVMLLAKREFHTLEDQVYYRGEIYADFKDLLTGRIFRVASTHLKSYDPTTPFFDEKQEEKLEGFRQLKDLVTKVETDLDSIDHIVIAGDYNEDQLEWEYELSRHRLLFDAGYNFDWNLDETEEDTGRKLDWIFHRQVKDTPPIEVKHMSLPGQDHSPSDHRMTGTYLQIKE